MSYSDWLYDQLAGSSNGGSTPAGLEDVIVEGEWSEDEGYEFDILLQSGKRYILDLSGETGDWFARFAPDTPGVVTDECQIWIRTNEQTFYNGSTIVFSEALNWMNEPNFPDGTIQDSTDIFYIISIQNNVAVCSEFTLSPGNKENWYGGVEA